MKFVARPLGESADASRGDRSWRAFVKNAVSVALAFVALYLALGALAGFAARRIPERWETSVFSFDLSEVDATPLSDDRALAIFERMVAAGDLRPLDYRLLVIPTEEPNAFAFPGGSVVLTRGLLESIESESGLALVIGHELGHHQYRHTLENLSRGVLFRGVASLLFGGRDPVVGVTLGLTEASHSRAQEREADEFGLRLVYACFEHVEDALEFLQDIELDQHGTEARWTAFAGTHPMTEKRLAYLGELSEQLATSRPRGEE